MKNKFFSNWILKLLSLFIAFGLWFVFVYFDDPIGETSFTDIQVEFLNEELLQEQNLVSEVLNRTDVVRKVNVKGKRRTLDNMKTIGVTVTATADFAKMREDQTIPIEFSLPSQYNSAINEIYLAEGSPVVELQVEELVPKNVRVQGLVQGTPKEGYQVTSVSTDVNTVTISGAASKVERVHHAAVVQDVTGADSDIIASGSVLLFDEDGNQLDSSMLQRSVFTTGITIRILATKEVPVEYEVYGEPGEGYRLTGEVEMEPETVKVAGTASALSSLESILVGGSGGVMDISGATESKIADFNLRSYLPSNVQLAKDEDGSASVAIYIEPLLQNTYRIPADRIEVVNVPEGWRAEKPDGIETYALTVRGLQRDLARVDEEQLAATIDLEDWMQTQNMTQPAEGSISIRLSITLPQGVEQVHPIEVSLILTEEASEGRSSQEENMMIGG